MDKLQSNGCTPKHKPEPPSQEYSDPSLHPCTEDKTTYEKRRAKACLGREVSVEPVLFFFNIASQMVWVTSQDLMVQKACRVNFGFPDYLCENLSDNDEDEVAVQEMVSDFLMWRSILETSIKIISVPLIGWWGDRWGRKGPLILCLSALGLESGTLLVNTLAASWPLEAIMCSSLFYGISGGVHTILMLSFSVMAEKTSIRRRTLRMGILDGFYYLGSPVGLAIASPLFRASGYAGVFGTSVAIYFLTIVYVIFRIPKGLTSSQDTERRDEDEDAVHISDCGVSRISDAFFTTFRPRPQRARTYILVAIGAMMIDSFVVWGESNVKYLFVQRALDWDYTRYNHYGTASSLLTVLGAFVVVPCIVLNTSLSDPLVGLLGAASRSTERAFYIFASDPSRGWLMYVGSVFGVGSPMAPIAIRSLLSKLAQEDVGQVYAVMAVGESLLPFVSAPTYTGVYEATVEGFPGAFYLLSIALNVLLGLSFLYISFSTRLRPNTAILE